MKYKVINVYSGYNEMSVNSIKEKESNNIDNGEEVYGIFFSDDSGYSFNQIADTIEAQL